jgi:hypothetical protein
MHVAPATKPEATDPGEPLETAAALLPGWPWTAHRWGERLYSHPVEQPV